MCSSSVTSGWNTDLRAMEWLVSRDIESDIAFLRDNEGEGWEDGDLSFCDHFWIADKPDTEHLVHRVLSPEPRAG